MNWQPFQTDVFRPGFTRNVNSQEAKCTMLIATSECILRKHCFDVSVPGEGLHVEKETRIMLRLYG